MTQLTSSDNQEPSFLRKLKAQYSGNRDGRHDRPTARPKMSNKHAAEDEPTYVVEESQETVTKAEYEALMERPLEDEEEASGEPSSRLESKNMPEHEQSDATRLKTEPVAAIGAISSKRKVAKIIGDDVQELDRPIQSRAQDRKKATKGKKVKLSFA